MHVEIPHSGVKIVHRFEETGNEKCIQNVFENNLNRLFRFLKTGFLITCISPWHVVLKPPVKFKTDHYEKENISYDVICCSLHYSSKSDFDRRT